MKRVAKNIDQQIAQSTVRAGVWSLVAEPGKPLVWRWPNNALKTHFEDAFRKRNGARISPVNMSSKAFSDGFEAGELPDMTDAIVYFKGGAESIQISAESIGATTVYTVKSVDLEKRLERRVHKAAAIDGDTGIATRKSFHALLNKTLDQLHRLDSFQGLLMVSVDNLCDLEMGQGLEVAESWRLQLVRKIKRLIGPRAAFGSVQFDCVGILLDGRHDDCATCRQVLQASAQRISRSLTEDMVSYGEHFIPRFKFMSVVVGEPNQNADAIVACRGLIDLNSLPTTQGVYTIEHCHATERVQVAKYEQMVYQAVVNGEFYPVVQPKVDMTTGAWVGGEVLLRWTSSQGPESPDRFITALSQMGLLHRVTKGLVIKMLDQLGSWVRQEVWRPGMVLSINVSPDSFLSSELYETMAVLLDQIEIPRGAVELEITEELFIEDLHKAAEQISCYQKLGIRVALDDFGTGFSSLSYLQRLRFDTLKIDRSFVAAMLNSTECDLLVKVMIDISHGMNMRCIAEGVENSSEAARLISLGCVYAQGFLYARPMPLDDIYNELVMHRLVAREQETLLMQKNLQINRNRH